MTGDMEEVGMRQIPFVDINSCRTNFFNWDLKKVLLCSLNFVNHSWSIKFAELIFVIECYNNGFFSWKDVKKKCFDDSSCRRKVQIFLFKVISVGSFVANLLTNGLFLHVA